ncbi:MAG: hypothetical protein E2593_03715 [Stenotrophomonas sp.]|nr:hypothetical protein [Stenotrophomonas sp.]
MKIKSPAHGKLPDSSAPEIGDKGEPIVEQDQIPNEEAIPSSSNPIFAIDLEALPADDTQPVRAENLDKPSTRTNPQLPSGRRPIRRYYLVPPKGTVCPQEHVKLQLPSKWAAYEVPGGRHIGSYESEEQATSSLEDLGYQKG